MHRRSLSLTNQAVNRLLLRIPYQANARSAIVHSPQVIYCSHLVFLTTIVLLFSYQWYKNKVK
jgi:hypothetical protein